MKQITTLRSFSIYFTDKRMMQEALSVIMSDNWFGDYEILSDHIDDGGFAIVEFWWDDITPDKIQQFLNEINRIAQ